MTRIIKTEQEIKTDGEVMITFIALANGAHLSPKEIEFLGAGVEKVREQVSRPEAIQLAANLALDIKAWEFTSPVSRAEHIEALIEAAHRKFNLNDGPTRPSDASSLVGAASVSKKGTAFVPA